MKKAITTSESRKLSARLKRAGLNVNARIVRNWNPSKLHSARLWLALIAMADRMGTDFLQYGRTTYPRGFSEFIAARSDLRSCSVCGCTDDAGCAAGCHWVGPNLCSECEDFVP